jgi:hypothetical protein
VRDYSVLVRITTFRRMMAEEFGPGRADVLAKDHVLSGLGGRTVEQALAAGVPAKEIWREVCLAFDVPAEHR